MPDPAPQDQDDVRRLLAEARHDEPLPPDVAARLDVLLGRLVEERAARPRVDDLAAHRHRRRMLLLVAAAAAVVAVATGGVVTQLFEDSGGSDSSASSAADSASDDAGSAAQQPESLSAPAATVALTSAGFDAEVARALRAEPSRVGGAVAAPSCAGLDPAGYDTVLSVTYDGAPAVLAARAAGDGAQQVDLFRCDGTGAVRSATVTP